MPHISAQAFREFGQGQLTLLRHALTRARPHSRTCAVLGCRNGGSRGHGRVLDAECCHSTQPIAVPRQGLQGSRHRVVGGVQRREELDGIERVNTHAHI